MASAREKALERISCIYYPVQFKGTNETQVQAFNDLGSKVNAMTSAYASRLGLQTCYTDVGTQRIDSSTLQTFEIVLADFQVGDKLGKAQFFQESFLLADISVEVVLNMLFFTLNNANV